MQNLYWVDQNTLVQLKCLSVCTGCPYSKKLPKNRTTHIQMHQQSSPQTPAETHHHQKANTRKYALKQHGSYTGNTRNKT